MDSLECATARFDRLDALKALALRLAGEIDECESMRDLAALSRQYRETMSDIYELENGEDDDDEASGIVRRHRQRGQPAAD